MRPSAIPHPCCTFTASTPSTGSPRCSKTSESPALARRTAQAAGLVVWGTLKILLEAKSRGITQNVGPWVDKLADAGMWLSGEIRQRILSLAGEPGE
ncbi:DUF3368 domain-containing protein [Sorangium sp. So ce327]|uniref:DUF3368 domain-containing protein n=1 Tax=Sorangium sp. So ce327 TaxID=3133301 RepID=UPI003F612AD2